MQLKQQPAVATDINQRVSAELVKLLYSQIGPILIAENVTVFIIVIGLFATTDSLLLVIWYLFNLFGSVLWRGVTVYKYKNRPADDQRTQFWLRLFLLGSTLSAFSWSAVGVVLLPLQTYDLQAFLIIFLFGVAAASNTIYSPVKLVYTSFLLIVLLPLAGWLLLQGNMLSVITAVAVVIFIVVMLITSNHAHQLLANSLKLRFENKELFQAKSQLESLNEDLYDEIKRRKKTEEMLEYLANHDVLTGLPNRALFQRKLKDAFMLTLGTDRCVVLLFIDLDNFKKVNDTLGHDVGDILLTTVGKLIKSHVRETDIVARLGGDEFTVILDNVTQHENAKQIAQKICDTLSNKIVIKGHSIHISASIGISFYPEQGNDLLTLIKHADIALYQAKAQGKNTFKIYDNTMSEMISLQQNLEERLHQAIAEQQFVLYYQPIVNLKDDKIIAVEALIRWRDNQRGLIPPSHFINFAEELGLIVPIGKWVMQEACRQFKQWQNQGVNLEYISVNVSAKQFINANFIETVTDVIKQTEIAPAHLHFEITESLFMHCDRLILSILEQLKILGVRVVLDDFGTGFSSLNYLKHFPVDIIKIDRGFLKETPMNEKNIAITKAIVTLGKSLNMKVTAEGIETKQQYEFIKAIGADAAQGYYLYLPLDANEIRQLFP